MPPNLLKGTQNIKFFWFFHPDYTVGIGISPIQPGTPSNTLPPYNAPGSRTLDTNALHRRWGIAPRPETDQNIS